jgi:hypothetical protein
VATFTLSERSPLPPPWDAKNLPGGRTQILNVRQISRINRYPVKCDEDSTPESISDTEDWLNLNGDLYNPDDSDDDCTAVVLAMVPFSDRLYYSGSMKTRPQAVRSGFVQNGSFN